MIIIAIGAFQCASLTGLERSKQTSVSLEALDNDIKLIVVQLDGINSSLYEVTKSGQSDIKKAFDLYTKNIENIDKMEKNYKVHSEELKSQGKNYFSEWKKEGGKYNNPEIQELSDTRRNELSEVYESIASNSVGVKDAFHSFVLDASEIQTYLSNDLTRRGVESITPISNRVQEDAIKLRNAIKRIQTPIEKARRQMVQQGK
ncbi:hypothetical protein [Leptospira sp. 'Mane']|uniref:hypothetical protein n=1 Tax=Leptospira sp. 'Mane' TaxID=3387407 RepID=UPI00398B3B9E